MDDRAHLDAYFIADSLSILGNDNIKLKLDGSLEMTTIKLADHSRLEARRAYITATNLTMSGTSDAIINSKEELKLHLDDDASLQLYGDPTITVDALKSKSKILKKE